MEQSFGLSFELLIDKIKKKLWFIFQDIAHTENLRFYNESEIVRRESMLLKEQGVNIIIVLSHCGLDVDYQIAKDAAPFVDVIVGGHSHTFMYTVKDGESAPGPDRARDDYPAVVENENGHKVLIVQASAYMKYVGDLVVYFDQDGRVVTWEGNPIYLDTHIKQGYFLFVEKNVNFDNFNWNIFDFY